MFALNYFSMLYCAKEAAKAVTGMSASEDLKASSC